MDSQKHINSGKAILLLAPKCWSNKVILIYAGHHHWMPDNGFVTLVL